MSIYSRDVFTNQALTSFFGCYSVAPPSLGEVTMSNVVDIQEHARATSGHKSGRRSPRETPVSRSMGSTNSAGTPRLDFMSQYQTWDCVVPMRSAKDFCPPANLQARLSASVDIHAQYPVLVRLQPKNMCGTNNRIFGTSSIMKQANAGRPAGYSQTNIGWLESGKAKDPRTQAQVVGQFE